MGGSVTIQDVIIFIIACTVVGGLALLLAGLATDAMGWGMTADEDSDGAGLAAIGADTPVRRAGAGGSYACLCSHEMRDDGRGEWDSVGVVDVVNPACPIHGPAGRGWQWIDITTTADSGQMRCIRGERLARSI